MRLLKRSLLIAFALTLLLTALYATLHLYVRDKLKLNHSYPLVESMPADALRANLPAYQGLPPWQQQRPRDPFPFPIAFGDSGPAQALFAGDKQYPFMCQGLDSGLGQPLVDNQQGLGTPVYQQDDDGRLTRQIIGYSQDCLLPTRLHYFYRNQQQDWQRSDDQLPAETDDQQLLVRVESGTINRFIYALFIPTSRQDQREQPDLSRWNGKLIYHFKGAIGIGFQQGQARLKRILRDMRPALEKGYAIAYSSGNETDNHYNILLQEDTALRVKQQFISRYGRPEYTLGFGDSGGALQQYLLAQNRPGLIQGGVAIVAYPDMTSQILYGLDCPLLEYYFDHLAEDKTFWQSAANRNLISGLAYHPEFSARAQSIENATRLLRLEKPLQRRGATECNYSWRGTVQMVNNPRFNTHYARYSNTVQQQNYWTHWQDNRDVYGTDQDGRAPVPWSNQGVQYGLNAWKKGAISARQFFDINRKIGGWQPQQVFQPERYWLVSGASSLLDFSPYQTANFSHQGQAMSLAPRTPGNLAAARGAYLSGNVFQGRLTIPLIDVRVYRDDILDIHHSWAALSSRQRILDHNGENLYQSIWMAERNYKQIRWDAFAALEQWLDHDGGQPSGRALFAQDRCVDRHGQLIASGADVWHGNWNQQATGRCSQRFPFFQSSRQVAGDSAAASTLFCLRISIDHAIRSGLYQPLDVSDYRQQLLQTFPDGVCDYRQPDLASPQ